MLQQENPTECSLLRPCHFCNSCSEILRGDGGPQIAANALENADYKCEYDPTDRTFLRKKSGKPYTEPHHLIPISRYKDFPCSVDVEENIVSLCSHCHNLLHYGCAEEREEVLYKLYKERIDGLRQSGLDLTFDQLKSYY